MALRARPRPPRRYSPLDIGCADPVHPSDNCTWRVVSVDAVINRTCHNDQFFAAVAAFNQSCFDACPLPPAGTVNSSDFCHVQCFYTTALGANASIPNATVSFNSGVPTPQLVDAWLSGFRSEDEGGCPRIPHNLYQQHDNHGDRRFPA